MSAPLYLLSICLPLATVLAVFGMRYAALTTQARARLAQEDGYRKLAETSAAAQSETAAALSAIQAALGDVQTRVTAVEKMLKDVG